MQAALGKQLAKSVDSKKRQTEIVSSIKSLQGLQAKTTTAPRASSAQSSAWDVLNDSNSYLPQLIEKIQSLVNMMDDPALADFKSNSELKQKTNSLISCLRQSATQNQNKAFYANLTEISDLVDQTKHQLERYLKANVIMKKLIAGDVRKKLRSLQSSLVFQERLIDSIYNSKTNPTVDSAADILASAHQLNLQVNEVVGPQVEREFRRRLKQLTKQLEELKQHQQSQPQIQISNDNQKKERKKTSSTRKTTKDLQNEKQSLKEAQLQQQKQVGGQLCMKADSMFFGIGQKADKLASIPLYEESAQNGSSKALLALAAIYEPTDSTKAFFYYDKAAENEPYALFKLGQFMENGLYEEGFRGKPNAGFAFAYYKKATQQEVSCPEALFKLGEYYQKGIEVERNIQLAIRKYEEAAAEGHVLAMNALGSLFYNDLKDFGQAVEWFKKASEKGCARSLNNLGSCYEFGHGVQVDRDQAYQLYKESASKGYIQAMLNLAHLTLQNANIGKSAAQYKESGMWFRKLTMQDPNNPEPYYHLAKMHEFGLGIVRDQKQAFAYYKKAASLNHAEALSKCGDFIYSGRMNGGLCDKVEAKKYYTKAGELGSATALNSLGLLVEQENKEEALSFYRQAHKMGNLDATVNFALVYLQTDPPAAKALLMLAVKKGHSRAAEYMVQFGLIPSVEFATQSLENDDSQVLAAIDGAVQNTPNRPSNRHSNLAQPGTRRVNETNDLQKPTHLISGSSGTHQHPTSVTASIQPAF